MAVVYPCEDDQRVLMNFTEFFVRQTAVQEQLRVSTQDVTTLGDACQSVLAHLERVGRLFLSSVPLNADDIVTAQVVQDAGNVAYQTGSVYPHLGNNGNNPAPHGIVLSESAGMAPMLLQNPKSYLRPQLDAVNVMVAELDSAREALRCINATYAYLWTTDVDALRQYIAQDEKRQRNQKPMWERVNMKALAPTEPQETTGPRELVGEPASADALTGHQSGATESGEKTLGEEDQASRENGVAPSVPPPTYRVLLALDPTILPSEQVQRSFVKFIQACDSLIEWADSVTGLLSGKDDVPKAGTYEMPPSGESAQRRNNAPAAPSGSEQRPTGSSGLSSRRPATKTVRIHRYEIRDVSHIYDMYYQQAECFFLPEYALFDARIHQRLVQPCYFYALRILMDEMSVEMERLRHIAGSRASVVRQDTRLSPYDAFQHGVYMGGIPEVYGVGAQQAASSPRTWAAGDDEEPPKIVFRPTLPHFAFLRNTLRVLLSICLNEDDRTSFKGYEGMYERLVTNAKDAVAELHHLPKPPTATREAEGAERRGRTNPPNPPRRDLILVSRESIVHETVPANKVAWVISAEDRGRLRGGFEAYWDLRDNVRSLKTALDKDIRRKDETHRTRMLGACVAQEKDRVTIMAIERERERREAALRERRESSGLLGAARASWRSLAGIATCKAEVQMEDLGIPTAPQRDDDGVEMTTTSPYHAEKTLLQVNVNRLWNAVEAHGIHMEREYPGIFYRGEKQRWARRIESIVGKANSVSVVFSP